MTDEVITRLEQAFSLDCTVEEACFYAGIHSDTYFDWQKKNPEISERLHALKNRPILKARQTIIASLGSPQHAQWYLSRKRKTEFSERVETDVTSLGKSVAPSEDLRAAADQLSKLLKERKT